MIIRSGYHSVRKYNVRFGSVLKYTRSLHRGTGWIRTTCLRCLVHFTSVADTTYASPVTVTVCGTHHMLLLYNKRDNKVAVYETN